MRKNWQSNKAGIPALDIHKPLSTREKRKGKPTKGWTLGHIKRAKGPKPKKPKSIIELHTCNY